MVDVDPAPESARRMTVASFTGRYSGYALP